MLPDRQRRRTSRQAQGRNSFVLEETVKRPPAIVTCTIADDKKMFSASWEHRLEDLGNGRSRLTVSETSTVAAAIPRALMRYVFGYEMYLKKFAAAIKAKYGG